MIGDFYRGDTRTFTLTFTDSKGAPINLSGAVIWFTMKKSPAEPDSEAVIQKKVMSHVDPLNGISSFTLTPQDTTDLEARSYFYDIQLVDAAGNVTTVLQGKINLLADITRSV